MGKGVNALRWLAFIPALVFLGPFLWVMLGPRFLVSRAWMAEHQTAELTLGLFFSAILLLAVFGAPRIGVAPRQTKMHLPSMIGVGAFVVLMGFFGGTVAAMDIWPYVASRSGTDRLQEATSVERISSTKGRRLWIAEGGGMFTRGLRGVPGDVRRCPARGSALLVSGPGNAAGIRYDRVELVDGTTGERIAYDWASRQAQLPRRCGG